VSLEDRNMSGFFRDVYKFFLQDMHRWTQAGVLQHWCKPICIYF